MDSARRRGSARPESCRSGRRRRTPHSVDVGVDGCRVGGCCVGSPGARGGCRAVGRRCSGVRAGFGGADAGAGRSGGPRPAGGGRGAGTGGRVHVAAAAGTGSTDAVPHSGAGVRAGSPGRRPGRRRRAAGAGGPGRGGRVRWARGRPRGGVRAARRRPAHHLRAAAPRRASGRTGAGGRGCRAARGRPSRLPGARMLALGGTPGQARLRRPARPAAACPGAAAAGAATLAAPLGAPRERSQPAASSSSRPRSRATRRECSWHTRDSVTPSVRPISARVRFSR